MTWRRLPDLLAVCLTATGLWVIAVWLWPYFGPVGIVVVLLVVVLAANLFDSVAALLRKRPPGQKPGNGAGPGSAVPVGHTHE